MKMTAGEIEIEVNSAELTSENETEALSALENEILAARKANPRSIVELGWYHPETQSGRSPSAFLSKAQVFIQKLKTGLQNLLVPSDHDFGLVNPRLNASNSFYLKNSNAIYTTIRLTHSYAGRVATFVLAGYGLNQSLELGLAVAFGCGMIAANYDWIMNFVKHDRAYNLIKPGKLAWLDRLRNDPEKSASLDRIHGKANWGFFEALFTVSVLGLETGLGKFLNIPVPFPSALELSFSFLAAFNSQQIWDRAVNRYEDLLNLQPNLSRDFKNASLRKRRAIGSVTSVVAMTASSMPYLPVKITSFALLIGLRQAGVVYEKIVDARIAKMLTKNECDLLATP